MPENHDLPEGYKFRMGKPVPTDRKRPSFDEVEAGLKALIEQQGEDAHRAMFTLAALYCEFKRTQEALPIVQHLVEITQDPGEKAHYWLALGMVMEQLNDFSTARDFYQQAYLLEPDNTLIWYLIHNNLGYCLNKLGFHPEAEGYCRKAIQIDPELYNAYKNLAIALQGQGHFLEAALNYIQAVKANASDPRALGYLEELVSQQPDLLLDNPALQVELENCRKAVQFAKRANRLPRENDLP